MCVGGLQLLREEWPASPHLWTAAKVELILRFNAVTTGHKLNINVIICVACICNVQVY